MMNEVVQMLEEKTRMYTLSVTEAEADVILHALAEYVEDTPLNTSTADHLQKKTELLNRCIRKEAELSEARKQLLEYAGIDFYDDVKRGVLDG